MIEKLIYKFFNVYNKIFKENFNKKLDFQWSKKPRRYEIINKIIKKKKYNTYLEIGCFKNDTFNSIIIKDKIGVDPVSGGTIRKTSDEFFKDNKNYFDICFIDGLHKYNQVRKDIFNCLNFLNNDGVILVHDCLPERIRDQMIPRSHEHWNGDVWKAIVEIRTLVDFDTYTCLADEGIGIIFKRPNSNLLEIDVKNFKDLKFQYFYNNHKEIMNIINEKDILKIF